MKNITDPLTGHDISIDLIGNTAVMYGNGKRIETPIRPSDLSMAKVALSKRDLSTFASFFND